MADVINDFIQARKDFEVSRARFDQEMPHESTNELQYMLNHIMKALCSDEDNALCIQKATGHLRRAHLDYLKFAIFTVYYYTTACHPEYMPELIQRILKARLLEFNNIGSPQNASIKEYREVLVDFVPRLGFETWLQPVQEVQNTARQRVFSKKGSVNKDTVLLYMAWVRLELLLVAIANRRFHNIIQDVIEAHYTNSLSERLPYIIAITKAKILTEFLTNALPSMQGFVTQVFADAEKQKILEEYKMAERAITEDMPPEDEEEARTRLIRAVEQPFAMLMKHLGVNLEDYPIEFENH